MKLIIDMPEDEYKRMKEVYEKNDIVEATYSYIYGGIPLDDVKDEIAKAYDSIPRYYPFALSTFADTVDKILDNIGKAESEDKK